MTPDPFITRARLGKAVSVLNRRRDPLSARKIHINPVTILLWSLIVSVISVVLAVIGATVMFISAFNP